MIINNRNHSVVQVWTNDTIEKAECVYRLKHINCQIFTRLRSKAQILYSIDLIKKKKKVWRYAPHTNVCNNISTSINVHVHTFVIANIQKSWISIHIEMTDTSGMFSTMSGTEFRVWKHLFGYFIITLIHWFLSITFSRNPHHIIQNVELWSKFSKIKWDAKTYYDCISNQNVPTG